MPFVAPWLDVNPRDFVGAAEKGAQLGLSSRSEADDTNLRRQQLAQSAAEQSQRLALEAQGQQTEAQRSNVENEVAQQRSALATQDAMQRFEASRKYQSLFQQLTASGVSPEEASMQAELTVGPNSNLAGMMRATAAPKFMDVNGVPVIQSPGGATHIIPPRDMGGAGATGKSGASESDDKKNQSLLDSYTKILNSPDSTDADKENARQWIAAYSKPADPAASPDAAPPVKQPHIFIGAPGGRNEIPGYDDSGAKITAPGTPAAGAKIATDDVLKQAMSASGGNKESARQWLQQNGYTIPGSATNAPAAVQPPQIQAPSPSAPKVGIPDVDMATKFQSQEREKRQKQAASSKMARSRQSATEGIEKAQKEIDEYVRQQKYLNRNYSDLAKGFEGIPPQDWDLTPEDRAVKIKAAQDRIAQFKSKLDSLYQ